MTNRLTTQELEAIRKRAELATKFKTLAHPHWFEKQTYERLAEDIPALLAEVEALQKVNGEYERALSQIAHGDTWTAYPHDIAAWALGLK